MTCDFHYKMGFVKLCILSVAIFVTVSCSGDKGNNDDQKLELQLTGNTEFQVWAQSDLNIQAVSAAGENITLSGVDLPEGAIFRHVGGNTGVLRFTPSISQLGSLQVKITAQSLTVTEAKTITVTVVDKVEHRVPLIPLAVSRSWVYQSVHDRQQMNRFLLNSQSLIEGRTVFQGQIDAAVSMIAGGIYSSSDTIMSVDFGPQFVIPAQFPAELEVVSNSSCYNHVLTREIEWISDPIVLPMDTYLGYFKFTTTLESECEPGKNEIIVEEINIKPGIGILSIAQIKASDCSGNCSSRWELFSYTIPR